MNHYEIVLLIHPDQSDEVPAMVERYRELVEKSGGKVHRFEDWGRRQLAYAINKVHKAHYLLLNIEVTGPVLDELGSLFRFSDAVLRNLVVKCDEANTEESPMAKSKEEAERASQRASERSREREERDSARKEETNSTESTKPTESTPEEGKISTESTESTPVAVTADAPVTDAPEPATGDAVSDSDEPASADPEQDATAEMDEPTETT